MPLDRVEYKRRQRAFADRLDGADLPGAVVVSRGGSTLDRYADVMYLTGHYQSYSYLPDEPGLFSSSGPYRCGRLQDRSDGALRLGA